MKYLSKHDYCKKMIPSFISKLESGELSFIQVAKELAVSDSTVKRVTYEMYPDFTKPTKVEMTKSFIKDNFLEQASSGEINVYQAAKAIGVSRVTARKAYIALGIDPNFQAAKYSRKQPDLKNKNKSLSDWFLTRKSTI